MSCLSGGLAGWMFTWLAGRVAGWLALPTFHFHLDPTTIQSYPPGRFKDAPLLRSYLCGSAGSGKTTTTRTIVHHLRLLFQNAQVPAKVKLTAYTGVAAFNIGFGAATASSAFQIFPNAAWKSELEGAALRRLEDTWRNVCLLIVDEVSFIGRAFFARMHFRLQQAKRGYFSEAALDPHRFTFGNVSILLVGDFGQLDPIDDWSMCDDDASFRTCPAKQRHLWKHNLQGKLLLQQFEEAVILKQIHRSKEDMWWTESCLRLRDFTCTKEEDWDYWRMHDLDRGHFTKEQKEYFDNSAVWICARCEDVGARNGRKLARRAEENKEVVHQIRATHSSKSAKKHTSAAFAGLREIIHLVRDCKVMLIRNIAYLFGLANGTRGTLVGIVYGPGGIGSFPEAIVVDVPEYTGPAFYEGEPTWVPILPMTSFKDGTHQSRTQFPVVAGHALTVNKAQGLTMKEGVVVHLAGSRRFRPASKHGLPFVAFTRSENFAMTAFKNLPPWEDFVHGRQSNMLRMRMAYMEMLEDMRRRTLAKHSSLSTAAREDAAQEAWTRERSAKRQKAKGPRMPCPGCAEYHA